MTTTYGYNSCLSAGWETGIHDCRPYRYQHPWVVVHRESGQTVGCWTRAEARRVLAELKRGVPAESIYA